MGAGESGWIGQQVWLSRWSLCSARALMGGFMFYPHTCSCVKVSSLLIYDPASYINL